jgi:outer membrane lipoprotein LolB
MHPTRGARSHRVLIAALLTLAIGACTAPGPVAERERRAAWDAHMQWLQSVAAWRASGRVAVATGDESWSASLRWRQADEGYRIHLSGPFGQGAVRVDGATQGVVLRTADGRVTRAATAEALLAAELGVQVPVSALRYWLLGRPAPGAVQSALDLDWAGRLKSLQQAGWTVRYQEYEDSGSGSLPTRLEISRERVLARFLIDRWQIGA